MLKRPLFILVAVIALTGTASAQTDAAIGLGLAVPTHDPTHTLGVGTTGIGPLVRIKLGTGFGPAVGFDWHSVGAEVMVGDERLYLGKVRLRPVMAGVAYNWNRGRFWVTTAIVGGYAFTSLKVSDQMRPRFRSALGATSISFEAHGSLILRPHLAFWYDAAPRVGVTAGLAYVGTQPTLEIRSNRGLYTSRLHAASSVVTFGLVYGVF